MIKWLKQKLNPAQRHIGGEQDSSKEPEYAYETMYENLEVVNRGINMIVDDAAAINFKVLGPIKVTPITGHRKTAKRLDILLNVEPNPFQDISTFRRNLLVDLLIDGNIFIYYDGAHLYHLPATRVTIHSDKKTYIEKYSYLDTEFAPNEIIHVKDNSFDSVFRGTSRLRPALRTMRLLRSMRKFQDNFFQNGAVPGLVLKTPDTLSPAIKEKMLIDWQQKYRPDAGGRRPLILDGGMDIDTISKNNFQELDFQNSTLENEKTILKALGIPPILLDSGNNANIKPNMRLYYLETIIPIIRKMNAAYSRYFGYEIVEDVVDVQGLQPELSEQASYLTTLVNGGIITPNEARYDLGKDKLEGHDEIRVPANIAGSASDPSQGGRPKEDTE